MIEKEEKHPKRPDDFTFESEEFEPFEDDFGDLEDELGGEG